MARTQVYKIKKGDNLDKIAKAHGLKSWAILYHDPVNKKLKKDRPDPNKVIPGDIVVIPNTALAPADRASLDALIGTVEKAAHCQDRCHRKNKQNYKEGNGGH